MDVETPENPEQQYAYGHSGTPKPVEDRELVQRCAAAFRKASGEYGGQETPWGQFDNRHRDLKDALETDNNEELGRLLRNPAETELFWGFDSLVKRFMSIHDNSFANFKHARSIYNSLIQVGIGIAALRINNIEANQTTAKVHIEELLSLFDCLFGFRLEFPNPFPKEYGLSTSRGIISTRAAQAIYQSWRIKQLCDAIGGSHVLEIGAGLGRNVCFARRFGIKRYAIVDIPSTQLAQGYYLGRIIGADQISLCGEPDRDIKLRSPKWLLETDEEFDLIINVDSLTELLPTDALAYLRFAQRRSRAFLTINHEFNKNTAGELMREVGMKIVHRSPYWPRAGYIEELSLPILERTATSRRSFLSKWRMLSGF